MTADMRWPQPGRGAQPGPSAPPRVEQSAVGAAGGAVLFCGMSIGFEDVTAGLPRIGRAPLGETVTFVDGH
ncbi:hypothetical protein VT52_029495 [Streptomyces malaysiense]|uniref:Uncharacterized protein n=1 Tax=Streptomyces malaysiense TaxID=1428626 RepID=A0A1J4PVZ8_9ACTN|nr:hypothetical protein VT52_029495 [Streptomyces malaysiense]